MATAYTIRYGKENAGLGPGVDAPVSLTDDLDGVCPASETEEGGGGGSMTEDTADGVFDMGSGRAGIGSSGDEVSSVMCLVSGGDCRRV